MDEHIQKHYVALGTIQVIWMFGLAHVGYLLGHAAKAGEPELASIFLRTQCLSDTHADTGLGQVERQATFVEYLTRIYLDLYG